MYLEPTCTHAVFNEDYELFEVTLTVPTNVTEGEVVCTQPGQLGIINDNTVEETQFFSVVVVAVSPAGTLTVGPSSSLTVNILDDNDCERVLDYNI